MTGEQLAGIFRAILAAAGGYLVSRGVIDEATMTAVVGGLVTAVVAIWSFFSKKK